MLIYLYTIEEFKVQFCMESSMELESYLSSDEFYKWFDSAIVGRFGTAQSEMCLQLDGDIEMGWKLLDFYSHDYDQPCIVLGRAAHLLRNHLLSQDFEPIDV